MPKRGRCLFVLCMKGGCCGDQGWGGGGWSTARKLCDHRLSLHQGRPQGRWGGVMACVIQKGIQQTCAEQPLHRARSCHGHWGQEMTQVPPCSARARGLRRNGDTFMYHRIQ